MGLHTQNLPSKTRIILFTVISYLLVFCLLAGLVTWLNLSWRPDIAQLPPDSGFYAYFAKAILHGQLPYRDLWDNKPPFGYYLNALGLLIFGQTPWGVWWSSVVWMTGCALLCFMIMKKLFGWATASITSILFSIAIMDPQIFQGGNLTEVYALAPQLGVIAMTYLFFTHRRKHWFVFFSGILTACTIMIKQPTMALGVSSLLIVIASRLTERKIREAIVFAALFALGFLSLIAIVFLYWWWQGALSALIDGAFRQGVSSIGGSQSNFRYYFMQELRVILPRLYLGTLFLIAAISAGIFLLGKLYRYWLKPLLESRPSWLEWCLLVVLAGFPLLAIRLWPTFYPLIFRLFSLVLVSIFLFQKYYRLRERPRNQQVFSPLEWTYLVAIVALPLEVLMTSLGGRYYGHYFTTMLPALILAVAYPIWRLASIRKPTFKSYRPILGNLAYAALAVCALVWGVYAMVRDVPAPPYERNPLGIFTLQIQLNELEQYIVDTTRPSDTVLVWHIHLGINFITDRYAPTRFLYPLNLFIPPNSQNLKLKQFVDELENHPPELIVVQKVSSLGLPFVDKPLEGLCDKNCTPDFANAIVISQIQQEWLRLQEYFDAHYSPDAEIYDWIIYRIVP